MAPETPPTLVSPAPDATSFTVNGVTYTATDGLSVARLRIFDRLALEFGFDASLRGMIAAHDALRAAFNKADHTEVGHLIYERTQALNMAGNNRLKEVEICALFFNSPDEDAGAYDFTAMQAKCYTQWAPVAGGFFTRAALRLLPTSRGSYANWQAEPEPPKPNETSAP